MAHDEPDTIVLDEKQKIGTGEHKACYVDPRDSRRCIKIPLCATDRDTSREIRYRRVRALRHQTSMLIPQYFGKVITNKGPGDVYERIVDFNGSNSMQFGGWLRREKKKSPGKDVRDLLMPVVSAFRDKWFEELIIVTSVESSNVLMQQIAPAKKPDSFRMRIVDNIGSHTTFPLYYWLDFLARASVAKYWRKFVRTSFTKPFPDLLDERDIKELLRR